MKDGPPFTPFAAFESDAPRADPTAETQAPPTGRLPSPPNLPHLGELDTERFDPLADLCVRVAELSDALHDDDGVLHRMFAAAERRAARRHREAMRVLRTIASGQLALAADVAMLKPTVERHGAQLKLVTTKEPAE